MRAIIKGGKIVNADKTFFADVLIENGVIKDITKNIKTGLKTDIIDARGKLVMPGAIDAHTHFQLPAYGMFSSNDFEKGTQAAACGGVTTIIDFATPSKGGSLIKAVKARRAKADKKVCIDYSLHGGLVDWNDVLKKEMIKCVKDLGVPTIKMFMIYAFRGLMSDDYMLYNALFLSGKINARVMVHAENAPLTEKFTLDYVKQNKKYAYALYETRPGFTEGEAVRRAVYLAKHAGGKLFVVHLSSKEGLYEIIEGKKQKIDVLTETCPQYLTLTASVYKKKDGHIYGTCPPLRTKKDNEELWRGLENGWVDMIATDSCPWTKKQKSVWKNDFTKLPYGMPGVETMLPVFFSNARERKFTLNKIVSLCSERPAQIHGMYPKKGVIAKGSDADIVIYDDNKNIKIDAKKLISNCDWSPYQNFKIKGAPYMTIARGDVIAKDGKYIGKKGRGKFIKRKLKT